MAKMFVCAVRDRAIDGFGNPIVVPALGAATRSFQDEIRSPDSAWSRHPEDFDLYHVGYFDTATGVLDPMTPAMVFIGKEAAAPLPNS